MSPVLKKKGKRFALCFSFKTGSQLAETKKRILSCDIGINNAAVMSVMEEDGTVIARRFTSFPVEEDRFNSILHEIRKAHSASFCKTHRLNRYADNYNEALSIKTASAIVKMAAEYSCDAIVMENLRKQKGKKYGSKAMRLVLWRKRDIAKRVERLAHSRGIRFSKRSRGIKPTVASVCSPPVRGTTVTCPLRITSERGISPEKSGNRCLRRQRPRLRPKFLSCGTEHIAHCLP